MTLRACRSLPAVLASPHDDAPRLALADEVASMDLPRARFIQCDVRHARAACAAIERAALAPEGLEAIGREAMFLFREHGQRWTQEDGAAGLWIRGLLEGVRFRAQPAPGALRALDEWPILHLEIWGSLADQPTAARDAIARMVTLELHDTDDAGVDHLLATYDLARLRKLTLRGALTERSLHALCTTPLPMLEELVVDAPGLRNPCETAETDDWAQLVTFAQRSELGQALERQYGWKKFLHAPSRFSIYPYPIEVLDILPALPERLKVLPRLWHPASPEPPDDI